MTRDELEATMRRNLTELHVPAAYHNAVVDRFLPAADAYRRGRDNRTPGPADIAAADRTILSWTDRTVHWQRPGGQPNQAICHGRITKAPVTARRDLVTCGTCMEARQWQEAS
jgi:hypothetical protein